MKLSDTGEFFDFAEVPFLGEFENDLPPVDGVLVNRILSVI